MYSDQNTDKKLIPGQEKRKDISWIWISFVVALILAIGAGLLVHFKNESRKKQPMIPANSYLHMQGTKTGPIVFEGNLSIQKTAHS